jgi:hypothetical protein
MVRDGFIAAGLLLALILGLLWRVSAIAQETYNSGSVGGTVNGLIATVTANAASSVQFSGANWSSNYNSLYLNCSALTASTSGVTLGLKVGESSPVTWETGAHYTSANYNTQVSNASDVLNMTAVSLSLTTTSYAFLRFTINNLGSSTVYKVISGVWGGVA